MKRLIDFATEGDGRKVIPLAGFPGVQLTQSTLKQNEFNAELQARSLYKLAEKTQPDGMFMMMDLSVEAGALGLPVRFPLAESATIEWHPVKEVSDLEQYKVVEPLYDGRIWVFLEAVRLLKPKLEIPLGAYVIGPFTLAGLMMGAGQIALATLDIPDVVHATVNFCEKIVIDYAKAMESAGADMICILDPTAMMLSPGSYWQFAGHSTQNVIRHLKSQSILHICGNTSHLLDMMCSTGAQGLSLDSLVSMPELAPHVPSDVVLIGNVNPVSTMLQGNRATVRRDTTELLEAMRPYKNFIVSTGCDLPTETPLENIVEMIKAVRDFE